jgi:perosamine synthetase
MFAEKIGVNHAITMNSCTSALEIALKASDIKGEVIIPSFTFIATANAVINSNCTPVFCDVSLDTRNVTPQSITACITKNTKAVIVVHYAGQPCKMDEIKSLCDKHSLLLIEDSAETIGARWKGKQAGSYGIGCFSFFPTKNITTAEGGMFTTNDKSLADRAKAMISHGIIKSDKKNKPWHREATYAGHNYRMSNPLAAIGVVQLKKLDRLNNRRKEIAKIYDSYFTSNTDYFKPPRVDADAEHVYQMYTISVVNEKYRDSLVEYLNSMEIGASVHFDPPLHKQKLYSQYIKSNTNLPNTITLSKTLISLPIYPSMTNEQVKWVLNSVQQWVDQIN